MAATLLFLDQKHPRQMLVAGTLAGVRACGVFAALAIVFEGRFDVGAILLESEHSNMLACLGGGILAGLLARCLFRDSAERVMGARLARQAARSDGPRAAAPEEDGRRGARARWEHARAMANLAEAAAAAIGADALLTRVGRLLPRPRQDRSAQVLRREPRARRALAARGARARRERRRDHGARRDGREDPARRAAFPSRSSSSRTRTTARR